MNKLVATCFSAVLFFFSCKTPSSVSKTSPVAVPAGNAASVAITDSMNAHAFRFEWFSGKAKIEVRQGSDRTEFTANFRIRNDSAIWVSISPALGLEAARVLITKDSIRVIDRINKEYYSTNFSYFKKYTSLPITLMIIQDVIEGNPLGVEGKQFDVIKNDSSYLLSWYDTSLSNAIVLDRNFMTVLQNIQDDTPASVSITQKQYDIQYTPPFSLWRKIELIRSEKVEITITFSRVEINEVLTFPFTSGEW